MFSRIMLTLRISEEESDYPSCEKEIGRWGKVKEAQGRLKKEKDDAKKTPVTKMLSMKLEFIKTLDANSSKISRENHDFPLK